MRYLILLFLFQIASAAQAQDIPTQDELVSRIRTLSTEYSSGDGIGSACLTSVSSVTYIEIEDCTLSFVTESETDIDDTRSVAKTTMNIATLNVVPQSPTQVLHSLDEKNECRTPPTDSYDFIFWRTSEEAGFVSETRIIAEHMPPALQEMLAKPMIFPIGSEYPLEVTGPENETVAQELVAAYELYKREFCAVSP